LTKALVVNSIHEAPNEKGLSVTTNPLSLQSRGKTHFKNSSAGKSQFLAKTFFGALFMIVVGFVSALLFLYQWGSQQPLARVDIFSGGVILFGLIWAFGTMWSHRGIFRSRAVLREAAGVTYDWQMFLWIDIFAVAEMAVFFEYGHWNFVPLLRQPILQSVGLAFFCLSVLWLLWTDRYLSRVFQGDLNDRTVITDGPYQFVRHPRYAGLMALQFAFALAMGSVLAWGFAVGWILVNMRRVRLEEVHLRKLFGATYERYCSRTPRFIPGAYLFLPNDSTQGED
jgi:protein-S-isoprenylcysteine O-methyltransferase Ste14